MRRKIILFCLIAMLVLSCSATAFAQGFDLSQRGSITMTLTAPDTDQPMAGAEFDVYYIATADINSNRKLNYRYTDTFEDCGISIEDPELSKKLDAYVEQTPVNAQRIITDSNGKAVCSDLPLGLYFVKQIKAADGFSLCTSFLVTVPIQDGTEFIYDVNATPKTDFSKLVSITVIKVWNVDESVKIPENVTVQLLHDGEVIKTAILNRGNNWRVTYPDMPESDAYSINEVNVPKGFTATYTQKNREFTVTNTASLAQTGQMVWPIPVLALAGLCFLMMGFVILRKPEKNDA